MPGWQPRHRTTQIPELPTKEAPMNHGSTPAYADAHLQPAAVVPPASPPGRSPRPVLGHYVSGVTPTEPGSYVSGVVPGAPASYVTGARADRAPGCYTDRDA